MTTRKAWRQLHQVPLETVLHSLSSHISFFRNTIRGANGSFLLWMYSRLLFYRKQEVTWRVNTVQNTYLLSTYKVLLYLTSSMVRNLLWVGTQLIKRISCCSGTWKHVNYVWNRQRHSTWTVLFTVATRLSCFLPHHFAFRAKVHYVGQTENWLTFLLVSTQLSPLCTSWTPFLSPSLLQVEQFTKWCVLLLFKLPRRC